MSAATSRTWAWSLLMLAALLPTIAAPDHWAGHHEEPEEPEHHAQHCHGAPSSCSDVPLTTVTGLAFLAATLHQPGTRFVRRPAATVTLALEGWTARVPCPPPKGAGGGAAA